jgi:hypothetical protein
MAIPIFKKSRNEAIFFGFHIYMEPGGFNKIKVIKNESLRYYYVPSFSVNVMEKLIKNSCILQCTHSFSNQLDELFCGRSDMFVFMVEQTVII